MRTILIILFFYFSIALNAQDYQRFTEKDGFTPQVTFSIKQDASGSLLFSGIQGINTWNGVKWSYLKNPMGSLSRLPLLLFIGPDETIWACGAGIGNKNYLYKMSGQDYIPMKDIQYVLDMKTDANRTMWIRIPYGLYTLTGNEIVKKADIKPGLFNGDEALRFDMKLFIDSKNRIWIPTGKGLIVYDNGTTTNLFKSSKLEITFCTLMEDLKENVWISSGELGIYKFDGTTWAHFTVKDSLFSDHVCYTINDNKGNLWAAHYKGGVSVFNGISWKQFKLGEKYYAPDVNSIHAVDLVKSLASGGSWENFPSKILIDKSGQIWYACTGGGLFLFNGTDWKQIQLVSHNSSIEMIEDSKGNIWFANYGNYGSKPAEGLFKYDIEKKSWNLILKENVHTLFEDKDGSIWGTVNLSKDKEEILSFK